MNNNLLKTGSCSIVVGPGHYGNYFTPQANKLFKVTKIISRHDEFKLIPFIKEIEDYENYYSIPESVLYVIKPDDEFYQKLIELTLYDKMNIFDGDLTGFYIDDAGTYDMIDSIGEMELYSKFVFWKSYKIILNFIKFMIDGLIFLHKKGICHLDIKPENIMVNKYSGKFKIIDFGFSSKEPFIDYINDIKGTPGYFPKYFEFDKVTPWLPKINANDMTPDASGIIPMVKNHNLVYKIDSYCLGRVLYYLKYIYDTNRQYTCFNFERKYGIKINQIIKSLVENNVHTRLTIKECKQKYFDE